MEQKVRLCARSDMASGEARRFDLPGRRIALVRIGDDFYAVDDTCSHANYSLSEGEVYPEEHAIECWKHGSTFSLTTGFAMNLPATRPIRVYRVEIEGDDVTVVLP